MAISTARAGEEAKEMDVGSEAVSADQLQNMTVAELDAYTKSKRPVQMMVVSGDQEAPAAGFTINGFDKLNPWDAFWLEIRTPRFASSIIAEWAATSMFLFFLILSAMPGPGEEKAPAWRVPVNAGFIITLVVYMFYGVSGGNVNPAVSWGLAFLNRMTPFRAIFYTIAQSLGAMTGCAMAKHVNPIQFASSTGGANKLDNGISLGGAVWIEMMGTLILVLVVLFATDQKRSLSHMHLTTLIPIMVGLVVMLDHFILSPFTGTSVNPARSFGSAVLSGYWENHWVFWVGPFLGSLGAAMMYKGLFGILDVAEAVLEGGDQVEGQDLEKGKKQAS